MRSTTALVLAAVAVVFVAAAVFVSGSGSQPRTQVQAGAPMFPGIAAKLAAAERVEIASGGKTLVLARKGDAWTLPDHDSYPIESDKLRALLSALAELRLSERRTTDPARFARLGLDDPRASGSGATLIRVLGANGTVIAAVLKGHGHASSAPNGTPNETTYVRRPDEQQTWLASGGLAAPIDALDWVAREVVNIPADSVATMHTQRDGAGPIDLARKGDKLAVTAPPDHAALDPFKVDDLGRALENVTMQDVRAAASVPGKRVGQAAVTTKAGLGVTATVYRDGDAVWLTLAAAGGAGAEATTLQGKVSGWAYKVEPSRETSLLPTMAGLAAYVPPAAPAKPATPPSQ